MCLHQMSIFLCCYHHILQRLSVLDETVSEPKANREFGDGFRGTLTDKRHLDILSFQINAGNLSFPKDSETFLATL